MWIILALVTAVFTASRDAAIKHVMHTGAAMRMAAGVSGVAALTLVPFVAEFGVPSLDAEFWQALLVSGGINTAALVLIARAVHASDLSLVSPLQSFTPAFMLMTGPLILGEWPTVAGALGVVLIVAGAWLLNLESRGDGVLAPFALLLRDTGARLMLVVAALYAISGAVDKVGVTHSSPLFWSEAVSLFVVLALAPLVLRDRIRLRVPPAAVPGSASRPAPHRVPLFVILAGLLLAVAAVAQMSALQLTLAAYVIAVKRTSILFGVVAGHVFFRERDIGIRLAGAAVMLTGVLVITLS